MTCIIQNVIKYIKKTKRFIFKPIFENTMMSFSIWLYQKDWGGILILTRRCRSKIHSGEERRKSVELKKKREINLLDTTKIKRHKNVENFPNFPMASENTSKSRFCQNLQMKYSEKNQNIAKMGQKKYLMTYISFRLWDPYTVTFLETFFPTIIMEGEFHNVLIFFFLSSDFNPPMQPWPWSSVGNTRK